MQSETAVVLLSGGLDSTTVLALAASEGYAVHALSFDYGQRHALELSAAQNIAHHYDVVQHVVMKIDLRAFGASALTADIPVPKDRPLDRSDSIPITYVPARNTIFLSYALAFAEVVEAREIFIGVNALDYSGYPDCRPEFIAAFEKMANLATRAGVEAKNVPGIRIRTPLIDLSKKEIIDLGLSLGVDYSMTTSCYDPTPDGVACGHCDACQLRLRGFSEAGVRDPAPYAAVTSAAE
ncbi:MAG TPA: 7-cyano-7-deazaguanine synthase QueC [Gemmatimonadaceae bacterium]|nr:7-cyano-7-deazaguanine synthase QueC [Gemmatimonadaceae bacterium]